MLVSSYLAPFVCKSRSHSEGLSPSSRGNVAPWLESEQHEKTPARAFGSLPKEALRLGQQESSIPCHGQSQGRCTPQKQQFIEPHTLHSRGSETHGPHRALTLGPGFSSHALREIELGRMSNQIK